MAKTVSGLVRELGLRPIAVTDGEREIKAGFAGDLLSHALSRLRQGAAWVTIMTNINVIAVASVADVACVIIADGEEISPEVAQSAFDRGVNLLCSSMSAFELCSKLGL